MIFIKRTLLSVGVWFFTTLLLFIPPVFAIAGVLGSTNSIESAIEKSGIYNEFVPLVLENAQKQNTDPQVQALLAESAVQSAVQDAFPPQTLRTSATSVIQGVFGWLQGKTAEPEFTIDLSESKQALTSNLSNYAEQRINALPVCTSAQLRSINPGTDVLSLPCRPAGVNTTQLSSRFSDQLAASIPFLAEPIITNKTLAKNTAKPWTSDIAQLPGLYQAAQMGKWLLLGLAILLAGMLILLRHDKRAGMRRVAWALVSAAALWGVIYLVYGAVIRKVTTNQFSSNDSIQAMVANGVQSLLSGVGKGVLPWILLYTVTGVVALLALRFWPRTPAQPQHSHPETPPESLSQPEPKEAVASHTTDTQATATNPKSRT